MASVSASSSSDSAEVMSTADGKDVVAIVAHVFFYVVKDYSGLVFPYRANLVSAKLEMTDEENNYFSVEAKQNTSNPVEVKLAGPSVHESPLLPVASLELRSYASSEQGRSTIQRQKEMKGFLA